MHRDVYRTGLSEGDAHPYYVYSSIVIMFTTQISNQLRCLVLTEHIGFHHAQFHCDKITQTVMKLNLLMSFTDLRHFHEVDRKLSGVTKFPFSDSTETW